MRDLQPVRLHFQKSLVAREFLGRQLAWRQRQFRRRALFHFFNKGRHSAKSLRANARERKRPPIIGFAGYCPMTSKKLSTPIMGLVAEVVVLVAVIGGPAFVQVLRAEVMFVVPTTW